MNAEHTGKIVRFTYDPKNPPRLTEAEEARLAAIRDEDIDLSDMPDQGHRTDWYQPHQMTQEELSARRAEARAAMLKTAEADAIRLDPDIARFLREHGGITPERVNSILRSYVASQQVKRT